MLCMDLYSRPKIGTSNTPLVARDRSVQNYFLFPRYLDLAFSAAACQWSLEINFLLDPCPKELDGGTIALRTPKVTSMGGVCI